MKKLLFSILLIICCNLVFSQKFFTKNGSISFFSKTNIENIQADNNQVMSVLNAQTGELQFSLLIKGFHFPRALMEEHFNENYLESDHFPKATFKGTIADIGKINFLKDAVYPIVVSGDLNMHGITNKVTSKGYISIKEEKITGSAIFIIEMADYKITIPKLVESNIAKTIEIKVNCLYNQKM